MEPSPDAVPGAGGTGGGEEPPERPDARADDRPSGDADGDANVEDDAGRARVGATAWPMRCLGLLPGPCAVELVPPAAAPGAATAAPAPPSALDLALRLAAAELACAALERWLGAALDIVPPEACEGAPPAEAPLSLHVVSRAAGAASLILRLPADALPLLPPITDEVRELAELRFEPLSARLRLARLAVPGAELAALGPGAALLLPESFGGEWRARLDGHGLLVDARLDPLASALAFGEGAIRNARPDADAQDVAAPDDGTSVEVFLEAAVPFDPTGILGGASRLALPRPVAGGACRVHIGGRVALVGRLAPLGGGHGVFALERVPDAPED